MPPLPLSVPSPRGTAAEPLTPPPKNTPYLKISPAPQRAGEKKHRIFKNYAMAKFWCGQNFAYIYQSMAESKEIISNPI